MTDPRPLAHLAVALYAVSLFLPAICLNNVWMLGYQAAACSLLGGLYFLDGKVAVASACVLGALANLLFVSTYLGVLLTPRHHLETSAGRLILALLVAALAATSILPLLCWGDLSGALGYLLWVGAAVVLAVAVVPESKLPNWAWSALALIIGGALLLAGLSWPRPG